MKTKINKSVMMVMLTTNSDMLGNPVLRPRWRCGVGELVVMFSLEVFFDRLHISHWIGIDFSQQRIELPLIHLGALHELCPSDGLIGVFRNPKRQSPKAGFVGF